MFLLLKTSYKIYIMKDKAKIIEYINEKIETNVFDIKQSFYHPNKKFDLIKDVVAFANSSSVDDKYIVFNIDNKTFELSNMDMSSLPDVSEIDSLLNEYCEPKIDIELNKFNYDGGQIAYLKVCRSNLDFPYMIKKNFEFCGKIKLSQGQIYIRRGATNFIANRSDLDILINKRVSRIIKIESQSIETKRIVVDNKPMLMYSSSFIFRNSANSNYLIKSAKINLKTPENIFSIKVAFIGNSDILAFTSKEFLDNKSFNIDANSTIEKSAFFEITKECKDILMKHQDEITGELILADVDNVEVISNAQLWSIK